MGRYRVEFRPAARREFLALPIEARQRLGAAISALADNLGDGCSANSRSQF